MVSTNGAISYRVVNMDTKEVQSGWLTFKQATEVCKDLNNSQGKRRVITL